MYILSRLRLSLAEVPCAVGRVIRSSPALRSHIDSFSGGPKVRWRQSQRRCVCVRKRSTGRGLELSDANHPTALYGYEFISLYLTSQTFLWRVNQWRSISNSATSFSVCQQKEVLVVLPSELVEPGNICFDWIPSCIIRGPCWFCSCLVCRVCSLKTGYCALFGLLFCSVQCIVLRYVL